MSRSKNCLLRLGRHRHFGRSKGSKTVGLSGRRVFFLSDQIIGKTSPSRQVRLMLWDLNRSDADQDLVGHTPLGLIMKTLLPHKHICEWQQRLNKNTN